MTLKSERIREQLRDIQIRREQVIAESTRMKLTALEKEETELRAALESLERVESTAKHAVPPSAEEQALWKEIRRLMDEEHSISSRFQVPERFVRLDAIEHFTGDLAGRRQKLVDWFRSLRGHQSAGARYQEEMAELDREEASLKRLKPALQAGIRIAEIRAEKEKLSAKRDELKAAREAAGLATV